MELLPPSCWQARASARRQCLIKVKGETLQTEVGQLAEIHRDTEFRLEFPAEPRQEERVETHFEESRRTRSDRIG